MEDIAVTKRIFHEKYEPGPKYHNDIALLKLKTKYKHDSKNICRYHEFKIIDIR